MHQQHLYAVKCLPFALLCCRAPDHVKLLLMRTFLTDCCCVQTECLLFACGLFNSRQNWQIFSQLDLVTDLLQSCAPDLTVH